MDDSNTSRATSPDPSALRGYTRRALTYLFKLRGSPEQIGRGVSVGLFVALTPTIGMQMPLAAFLATLLGGNRPIAVAMVWITNPFTMAPIYTFIYKAGVWFWPGTPDGDPVAAIEDAGRAVAEQEMFDLAARARAVFDIIADLLLPLSVGAIVVGLPLAAIAYLITVRMVTWERERIAQLRARRAERRAQRLAARRADRRKRRRRGSGRRTG